MLKTARNGGSITPRYQKILKQHIAHERLSIHTRTVISEEHFDPISQTWRLTTDPPIPDFPPLIDYIFFATGMKSDIREIPLLRSMNRDYPIEVLQGMPCLTDDLMWKPDVPLFVTGRLAALRLGPAGPNLEGARLGAERVAWALDELLGGAVSNELDVDEQLQRAFCGLGNRYAGLAECPTCN
jgi:hypothetical protein